MINFCGNVINGFDSLRSIMYLVIKTWNPCVILVDHRKIFMVVDPGLGSLKVN